MIREGNKINDKSKGRHAWGGKEYRTGKTFSQLDGRFKYYITVLCTNGLNILKDTNCQIS